MTSEANFIFEALSDVWDEYEDRDQIMALWEGYLQIASDLVLQLFQADLSKSIVSIPVFRRYRWLHYDLARTVVPSEFCCSFVFAYESGDTDILNIPYLTSRVRTPEDDEYLQITNSSSGILMASGELIDLVNSFPGDLRVGDSIRLLEGAGLASEDTDRRFLVTRINSTSSVQLESNDMTAATGVRYVIERSPLLQLVENVNYVVSPGKLNFSPVPVLSQDSSATAFQVVKELQYTGNFLRDDPRLIASGGASVTGGTGGAIVVNRGVLSDSTLPAARKFQTGTVPVLPGDYLVVRPSGSPQVLTTKLVSRVVDVISDTELEVEDRFTLTANQLTFDVLRASSEDFDLVSTEAGSDDYPYAYAFQVVGATSPSSTTASLLDQGDPSGDVLLETNLLTPFSSALLGKEVRVLSGTGLDPAELESFIIKGLRTTTNPNDTALLDRKVVAHSTAPDATYIVGDTLEIDLVSPVAGAPTPYFSDELEVRRGSSNLAQVTDGTLAFKNTEVMDAQPFIRSQSERAAAASSNEAVPHRLWAEETIVDQDQLFKNFGFPIQVNQPNSDEYKAVLQGLWFAYWHGPTLDNIIRGLNLVFSLPYAPKDGVISDISLPDPAVLEGTVESLFSATPNTFDTSAGNPLGDSRFLSFEIDNQPPVLVTFTNDPVNPNTAVRDATNLAVGSPIASLTPTGKLRLTALTSVKIDTVIGNPGLGFAPGDEDFGTFYVKMLFDDGTSETQTFGTQFPLAVEVGDRVEQFQPLTTAVGIFDYVSLPGWWDVFGIGKINPTIETFSQEDKDIVNDILKDFTFAVRVVADAFTRLGPVDRDIIKFFLEQIKPTISDYIFIVAERFYDLITMTDDRDLLGFVPAPSPEYKAQNSGQASTVAVGVGVKNVRNIQFNYANRGILGVSARQAFEQSYQLPQYDDARLDTEDLTCYDSVHVHVFDGVGATSYRRAEINGTVKGNLFDTSQQLVLRWNGFVPIVVPPFPANPMLPEDIMAHVNAAWSILAVQGLYPAHVFRAGQSWESQKVMLLNPDRTFKLYADRYGGVVPPRIEVLIANPGLGFPLSNVAGSGTTSGIIQTVNST